MVGEDSLGSRGQDRVILLSEQREISDQQEESDKNKLLTHYGEPGSVALPCLAAVLMLGDAPVCREGILLLNIRDVKSSEGRQREPVT